MSNARTRKLHVLLTITLVLAILAIAYSVDFESSKIGYVFEIPKAPAPSETSPHISARDVIVQVWIKYNEDKSSGYPDSHLSIDPYTHVHVTIQEAPNEQWLDVKLDNPSQKMVYKEATFYDVGGRHIVYIVEEGYLDVWNLLPDQFGAYTIRLTIDSHEQYPGGLTAFEQANVSAYVLRDYPKKSISKSDDIEVSCTLTNGTETDVNIYIQNS